MILGVMKKRRSVRKFKPEPLSDETVWRLLEAAGAAPSAGNKQPWRFLVVRDRGVIETAASIVDEERLRWAGMLRADVRFDFEKYSQNFTVFRNAPSLIVPFFRDFATLSKALDETASPTDRKFMEEMEHGTALTSVSLAIQNLLLMAADLGVGACCMTGPLIAKERIGVCFKIPDGWQIAAIVAAGHPDEEPSDPGRKPIKTLVRWL